MIMHNGCGGELDELHTGGYCCRKCGKFVFPQAFYTDEFGNKKNL